MTNRLEDLYTYWRSIECMKRRARAQDKVLDAEKYESYQRGIVAAIWALFPDKEARQIVEEYRRRGAHLVA